MVRPATTNWHFYFAAIDIPTHVEDMPDVASQWEAAGIISIPESGTALPSFEAFLREVTTGQPLRATGLRLSAMHLVVEVTRLFAEGASSRSLVVHPAVAGGGSSTPARPNG